MQLMIVTLLCATLSIIASVAAQQLQRPIVIFGSFLQLRLSHNAGIAFSIALPVGFQSILIVVALITVIIVALRSARGRLSDLAFGMIIGGAIGNLVDRIHDGVVTDFISVGTFPIFNIADSFICIGVGILLLEGLFARPLRLTQ